jgi:ribosomal protein L37AE/L43A
VSRVWIDHETGLIHGLPEGPAPLNGPTTGAAYQELKRNEKEHRVRNAILERQMRSTYQCTECKRRQSGKNVRVKWRKIEGTLSETLVCFDTHCDGPVILVQDAGPLLQALQGRLG